MKELLQQIKALLASQLDGVHAEALKPDTRFSEINADSINILETLMSLEDLYDVEFPETEWEQCQDLDEMASFIEQYLKSVGK